MAPTDRSIHPSRHHSSCAAVTTKSHIYIYRTPRISKMRPERVNAWTNRGVAGDGSVPNGSSFVHGIYRNCVDSRHTPTRPRARHQHRPAGSHWLESYRIGSGPSHPRVRDVVVGSYVVCHHWRPSGRSISNRSIRHNCAVVVVVVVPLYRCSSTKIYRVLQKLGGIPTTRLSMRRHGVFRVCNRQGAAMP